MNEKLAEVSAATEVRPVNCTITPLSVKLAAVNATTPSAFESVTELTYPFVPSDQTITQSLLAVIAAVVTILVVPIRAIAAAISASVPSIAIMLVVRPSVIAVPTALCSRTAAPATTTD